MWWLYFVDITLADFGIYFGIKSTHVTLSLKKKKKSRVKLADTKVKIYSYFFFYKWINWEITEIWI